MPYPLAPAERREAVWIFEKQQLAISNWRLAKADPKTFETTKDTEEHKEESLNARQIEVDLCSRQTGMTSAHPRENRAWTGPSRMAIAQVHAKLG
jgi:hypothetical protein